MCPGEVLVSGDKQEVINNDKSRILSQGLYNQLCIYLYPDWVGNFAVSRLVKWTLLQTNVSYWASFNLYEFSSRIEYCCGVAGKLIVDINVSIYTKNGY